MTELRLHSRLVHTVFDLLGDKEDDITYSLGWALAQSDDLVYALLGECLGEEAGEIGVIRLQDAKANAGRTDVEIQTEQVHLILEAKRGWDLPRPGQLEQYTARFEQEPALPPCLAVVRNARRAGRARECRRRSTAFRSATSRGAASRAWLRLQLPKRA